MPRCAGGVCALPGNNAAIQGNNSSVNLQNVGGKKAGLGQFAQFPIYNQQQNSVMDQLLRMAQGQLSQQGGPTGGGPGGQNNWQQYFNFAPIEQQARTQFNTQTIPTLAERFTAMGGEGGQRSSAFQSALGRAGSDLELGLAALKAQYGLPQAQLAQNQQGQQLQLLQTLLQGGLGQRSENSYFPKQPSAWGRFFGQAAGGLAQGLGSALPLAFL